MNGTITLPRSVVEQALKALYEADSLMEHHTNIELRRSALVELRAALKQPQVNTPEIPEGWKLVPVEPTEDMLAAVAWPGCAATDWEHMLAAAPQPPVVEQPQGEQEPAMWMNAKGRTTSDPCRASCWRDSGPVTPLYTHPQPKRQPLTDAQINDHRLALPYDGEDLPDPWDFKQGVRAAERAHGIGGEA